MTDPLVGTVLDGRYRVEDRLARGGMSIVYTAHDQRLDRTVAVKVMNPELAEDPAFLARFTREARSAAKLSHPNVVAVYDQGTDQGHVFLVMELIRGGTLRSLLRERGRLTPGEALAVCSPILAGLAAAHREGLVHRDVKPENVLISHTGRVCVADFGLARAIAESSTTTQTGGVLFGTVAYLSPEQVARGGADPRSDVYSAGILLYEALTGHPPYVGDNAVSVAYRHVHDDVPPPSEDTDGIPGELDDLVIGATNREPSARPLDAGVFHAEVSALREDLDVDTVAVPVPVPKAASSTPANPTTRSDDDSPSLLPAAADTPTQAVVGSPDVSTPDPPAPPAFRIRVDDDDDEFPPAVAHSGGYGERPATRRDRHRTYAWIGALVALTVIAAAIGWWFGEGRWTKVPGLTSNLTIGQAKQLTENAGLGLEIKPSAFSETIPKDHLISVTPKPGTDILLGSDVTVVVSRGPERYVVDEGLIGDDQAKVLASLKKTFGKRITVTTAPAHDETIEEGSVVGFDPPAGTELRPGDTVTVIVSDGPEPVALLDVTGQTVEDATVTLGASGLVVSGSHPPDEFSDTAPKGTVARTDPPAGTPLQPGDKVTLVLSKGQDLVEVPDVFGLSSAEAKKVLEQAEFVVELNFFLGGPFDKVSSQDPSGGSMAKRGSTITLTVV